MCFLECCIRWLLKQRKHGEAWSMTTDVTGALDMGVLLRVLYKMAPETEETLCMTTDVTGALDMGVLLRVLYKMTPETDVIMYNM